MNSSWRQIIIVRVHLNLLASGAYRMYAPRRQPTAVRKSSTGETTRGRESSATEIRQAPRDQIRRCGRRSIVFASYQAGEVLRRVDSDLARYLIAGFLAAARVDRRLGEGWAGGGRRKTCCITLTDNVIKGRQ